MAASSALPRSRATRAGTCLGALVTVLFLSACAVPLKYKVQDTPHAVTLEDLRPAMDGVRLRGVGTAGYALFFNASEVATSTLMTAIDQIIEQIKASSEDLQVSVR